MHIANFANVLLQVTDQGMLMCRGWPHAHTLHSAFPARMKVCAVPSTVAGDLSGRADMAGLGAHATRQLT